MDWKFYLCLLCAIRAAFCAEVDPDTLLRRVKDKVADDAKKIPRYYCRQRIERRIFASKSKERFDCAQILSERERNPSSGMRLDSLDRAKLDVMLAGGEELYSWPGRHRFDASYPGDLLAGGMAGSGDFASFRLDIFTKDLAVIHYKGVCEVAACVEFDYVVPQTVSHYSLRTGHGDFIVGYHGTFRVDPRTAEILALSVRTIGGSDRPDVCSIDTRMNYAQSGGDSGEFMIPAVTEKDLFLKDGAYFENKVFYEQCRQYSSESVLKFGDEIPDAQPASPQGAPAALPAAGTQLELRLLSKIESEASFAGDSIEAVVTRRVRDSTGMIIPAKTVVRGHIAQLQQVFNPAGAIILALRFDSLVLSGTEIPVKLEPINERNTHAKGVYVFRGARFSFGPNVESRWRVTSVQQ